MQERPIFWERPVSVAGPLRPEEAAARLASVLARTRFTLGERLVGKVDGERVRVWRKTPMGGAADVVEFEGVIRPQGAGSVIEGVARFKLATRIQLLGFLGIGVLLAAVGGIRMLRLPEAGGDLAAFGLFVAALAAAWIWASHSMRGRQIGYIESRLAEAAGTSAAPPP